MHVRTSNLDERSLSHAPLEWYLKLTDMKRRTYQEPEGGAILQVGSGPQFVALVEGSGPAAFRPDVGFGVQGFAPDQIMKRLAEHGASAKTRIRRGETVEILVDAPDGIEIQLQDVSHCGGRGRLGNMCG